MKLTRYIKTRVRPFNLSSKDRYWIIDAPGITGMGGLRATERLNEHIDAGGSLVHEVNKDGFLVHPEAMWTGRGLKGKLVRPDGTIVY